RLQDGAQVPSRATAESQLVCPSPPLSPPSPPESATISPAREELRQAAQQELAEKMGLDDTPPADLHPQPHHLGRTRAPTSPGTAAGTGRGGMKDKVERAFPIACLVAVAGSVTVVASDACPSSRRRDWHPRHH